MRGGADSVATLVVFARSPDRGRGLARDMAVRWALEELGRTYRVRPVDLDALQQPEHLALQPFGQIPAYQDDEVALFESGAIVLHLAQRWPGLLPVDNQARASALAWMFAAANTIEPPVMHVEAARFAYADEAWAGDALKPLERNLSRRLSALERHLGTRPWLDESFSAGDILMVQALRRLDEVALRRTHRVLHAYVCRCVAREAFKRAFAAQWKTYQDTLVP